MTEQDILERFTELGEAAGELSRKIADYLTRYPPSPPSED